MGMTVPLPSSDMADSSGGFCSTFLRRIPTLFLAFSEYVRCDNYHLPLKLNARSKDVGGMVVTELVSLGTPPIRPFRRLPPGFFRVQEGSATDLVKFKGLIRRRFN